MDFAWVVDALRRGLKVTRRIWAGEPLYIELTAPGSNSIIAVGEDTQVENWLCLDSDIFADDWEEYVEPKKEPVSGDTQILRFVGETTGSSEANRIVCAISDIAQFADDLAKGASEQLGIKVDKRDILVAIVDVIIQAGETDTPVKELLQDAYEKALKKTEPDPVGEGAQA